MSCNRIVSPGLVTHETVFFRSNVSLSSVTVRVVPALAPYVTASPATIGSVTPSTSYAIRLTIAIPIGQSVSVALSGAIQLLSGTRVIAQPLPLTLDFEFSSFKLIDPSKLVVSSDGSVFPVNQLIVRLTSAATFTDVQDIVGSLGAD